MSSTQQHFEVLFAGVHGDSLFYQFFPSHQALASGSLLITHGQGEYGDMYLPLIHFLQDKGWNVLAWDLRGHGRSSGKRGYAHQFDDYIEDFFLFLQELKKLQERNRERPPTNKDLATNPGLGRGTPLVCFAHSMGCLIQAKALLMNRKIIKEVGICGQVLSCPCFGVAMDVPKWKTYLGKFLNKVYPKFTLNNGITDEQLMQNPERDMIPAILRHRRTCFNVYQGILEATDWLAKKGFEEIQIPTLMQLGGKEEICDNKRAESLFNQIKEVKKTLKIYGQSQHEIYSDIEKEEVYNDLCLFLKTLPSMDSMSGA